eukprot:9078638-Pyramimonas_sp.AAC.1
MSCLCRTPSSRTRPLSPGADEELRGRLRLTERAAWAAVTGDWRRRASLAMGNREVGRSSSKPGGAPSCCCHIFKAYTAAL